MSRPMALLCHGPSALSLQPGLISPGLMSPLTTPHPTRLLLQPELDSQLTHSVPIPFPLAWTEVSGHDWNFHVIHLRLAFRLLWVKPYSILVLLMAQAWAACPLILISVSRVWPPPVHTAGQSRRLYGWAFLKGRHIASYWPFYSENFSHHRYLQTNSDMSVASEATSESKRNKNMEVK